MKEGKETWTTSRAMKMQNNPMVGSCTKECHISGGVTSGQFEGLSVLFYISIPCNVCTLLQAVLLPTGAVDGIC